MLFNLWHTFELASRRNLPHAETHFNTVIIRSQLERAIHRFCFNWDGHNARRPVAKFRNLNFNFFSEWMESFNLVRLPVSYSSGYGCVGMIDYQGVSFAFVESKKFFFNILNVPREFLGIMKLEWYGYCPCSNLGRCVIIFFFTHYIFLVFIYWFSLSFDIISDLSLTGYLKIKKPITEALVIHSVCMQI